MEKIEQEILAMLLNALYKKVLVTKEVHDQVREKILCIANWPEWFWYSDA